MAAPIKECMLHHLCENSRTKAVKMVPQRERLDTIYGKYRFTSSTFCDPNHLFEILVQINIPAILVSFIREFF